MFQLVTRKRCERRIKTKRLHRLTLGLILGYVEALIVYGSL
nr:MAG TPA: hypothetical protein [Caudoviricetes sp.]